MNKSELVDKAAEIASAALERQVTKKEVNATLDAVLEAIAEAVAAGDKVTLVGFGTFERRDRKERIGRNPKSGEEMTIPAAKVPAFSPGKQLKDRVNPKEELATAGSGKGKRKK